MKRTLVFSALAVSLFAVAGLHFASAQEPKQTATVDIASSVADETKLQALSGTGVILDQKEWERLAADWGIKDVPKVDFTKELLLVGTWRGTSFKMLTEVKDGDLTVELVGDKEPQPGFRFKVISLERTGITKFQGRELPKPSSDARPIKGKGGVEVARVPPAPVNEPPTTSSPPSLLPPPPAKSASVGKGPVTNLPVTNLPVTNPPVTNLPATNEPVTSTPATNTPVVNFPVRNLPAVSVRTANLPVTNLPVVNRPVVNLPVTNQPVVNLPVTNRPVTNLPVVNVPVTNRPAGP